MLFRPPDPAVFTCRSVEHPGPRFRKRRTAPQIVAIATGLALKWSLFPATAAPVDTSTSAAPAAKAPATSYYLIQRISITTDSGIRSLDVGTEVMLVKRGKNGSIVRLLDGTELEVSPGQITQDAARAQQLADQERGKAAANAESARARAEAQAAADSARRDKEVAAAQDYVRQAQNAALSAPATPPPTPRPWGLTGSALDEKPKIVGTVKPPPKKK